MKTQIPHMRSFTTRLIIVMASVLIAAIIVVQVYWLNKTYNYEKKEFTTSVLKAIRGVYEDIPLLYDPGISLDNLTEHYNENTFLFRVDTLPSRDSLLLHLSAELETFHVFTDYKVALYSREKGAYLFQEYVSADASRRNQEEGVRLPLIGRNYHFVHLYFPDRKKYIIHEMKNWIYASIVLLLLLIGFSFSIYYFLKQKFLVEIQKDFINNVTHEFSTPLSVIELSLEGLEKPNAAANTARYEKLVSAIRYQADYLKQHIGNLINTVVAGHYHLALQRQPVSPNELLRRAVQQLDSLLAKKGGDVEWQLEDTGQAIPADEENLYLAIYNIINNAIKYAERPHLVLGTAIEHDRYIIRVRDNGPGIHPSQQKKIFQKFYRAPGATAVSAKGLGLGLYFSQKVIRGHRGQVRVHSVPGIGSEFIIDLPLK